MVLYKGLVMKGNIGDLNDVVWITSTYKHGPKMVKKSPNQTVTVRIEEVRKCCFSSRSIGNIRTDTDNIYLICKVES